MVIYPTETGKQFNPKLTSTASLEATVEQLETNSSLEVNGHSVDTKMIFRILVSSNKEPLLAPRPLRTVQATFTADRLKPLKTPVEESVFQQLNLGYEFAYGSWGGPLLGSKVHHYHH